MRYNDEPDTDLFPRRIYVRHTQVRQTLCETILSRFSDIRPAMFDNNAELLAMISEADQSINTIKRILCHTK